MLHLRARFVSYSVTALLACCSKAKLAHDPAQCGIADINAVLFDEDLVRALNPTVALMINTADQIRVDLNLIASGGLRQLTALVDDGADRIGADVHVPSNFSDPHTFFVQKVNRFTFVGFDHKTAVLLGQMDPIVSKCHRITG